MGASANINPNVGAAAGPPSSRPATGKGPVSHPAMVRGPMGRKAGGRVTAAEAKRKKAIADALRLIAQSPEFGAVLRGAEEHIAQHSTKRR